MKILIIKPSSFGDIIQANPAYNVLRNAYPDALIDWVVFDSWLRLLDLFAGLNRKIIWNKSSGFFGFISLVKELRKTDYDLIIDLQGLMRTALLAFFVRGKKKIGVPGMKEFSNLIIKEAAPEKKNINAVFRSIEAISACVAAIQEPKYALQVPQSDSIAASRLLEGSGITASDILVGLVLEARGKGKQWPKKNYKELALKLLTLNERIKIVLLGTSESSLLMDERVISLEGKTQLNTLAGLLERCALVIGPDTGPVHMASGLGIPVIMYFGASDVHETSPIAENATVMTMNYPCSPCRSKPYCDTYPCLESITVDSVLAAAKQYLKT